MKQFMHISDYSPIAMMAQDVSGDSIADWALSALATAISQERRVQFDFNGILMNVMPDMRISDIVSNYHRKYKNEYVAYQNSAEGMKGQTMIKLNAMKKKRIDAKVSTMIANEKFRVSYPFVYNDWKNNTSEFKAAFEYAEKWAKLMQVEMRAGKRLTKKLINRTGRDADVDATNAICNFARNILVSCWARGAKFGEILHFDIAEIRQNRWQTCIKNARLSRIKQK